jgi:hypothetical protein
MTRRRLLAPLILVTLAALAFLRPALATTDSGSRLLVLLRGQAGSIRFVNSVTHRPVEIDFRIGARFDRFAMRTDAGTEEYYTAGLYAVNDVAAREATDVLRFCSMSGMHVTLGWSELDVKDGCLEVKLP